MFNCSPAIAFFVRRETQEEVDHYWTRLPEGGAPQRRGWLTDRFGVSWQIVPTILGDMLRDKDVKKAGQVMEAMLKMIKLDVQLPLQEYEREH